MYLVQLMFHTISLVSGNSCSKKIFYCSEKISLLKSDNFGRNWLANHLKISHGFNKYDLLHNSKINFKSRYLFLIKYQYQSSRILLKLAIYRTRAIRPRSICFIFRFFVCGLFEKAVYSRKWFI